MSIEIDGVKYFGIIYKIENLITHKVYIGQTTNPNGFNGRYLHKGVGIERVYNYLLSKKESGAYYNQYLLRSIETCGLKSFIVDEVFDTAMTKDELNDKEVYYIAKFNSYVNGFNMSYGGDGNSGYARPRSGACKNSKRVCQISPNGELVRIWDSATDACKELGIPASSISNVCHGKKLRRNGDGAKTAGGFVWIFECEYDPQIDYGVYRPRQNMGHGCKSVLLLSDEGKILQEFYSLNYAAENLGMSTESVRQTCLHKYKNPRFNLVYKSEYIEEQRLNVREPDATAA